jgi:uncharacterized RDD family membrane protein YckC
MSVTRTASAPRAGAVTSAGPVAAVRAAETDRRFYAFALDRVIAWGIDLVVALVAQHYLLAGEQAYVRVLLVLATMLAVDGVLALMLGVTGFTPGRWCCGLRVVDVRTGRPIGTARAVLRAMIVGCAMAPFGLGLAALARSALDDPEQLRRGWHDRLVSSVVVDVRPLARVEQHEDTPRSAVVNLTAMRLVPARRTPSMADPARDSTRAPGSGGRPGSDVAPAAWGLVFDTGERVRVDTSVLIGRRPAPREGERGVRLVALPSVDRSVSETHAQVLVTRDRTLVVTDLGSTNGSVLRRQSVSRQLTSRRSATLLEGDVLHLGDRSMTVVRLA